MTLLGLESRQYSSLKESSSDIFSASAVTLSSKLFAFSYDNKWHPFVTTNKYYAVDTMQMYWKLTSAGVTHTLLLNTDKLLNTDLLDQAITEINEFGQQSLTFDVVCGGVSACPDYAVGLVFGTYVSPIYNAGHVSISRTDGKFGFEYIQNSSTTYINSDLIQFNKRGIATNKTTYLWSYATGAKDVYYHKYTFTIDFVMVSAYPNPYRRVLQVRIEIDDVLVASFQIPNITPFDGWENLMPYITMTSVNANEYVAITSWMVRG